MGSETQFSEISGWEVQVDLAGMRIQFAHINLSPAYPIVIYNATTPLLTIPAGTTKEAYDQASAADQIQYGVVDYAKGFWYVRNTHPDYAALKNADNADYTILFSDNTWALDSFPDIPPGGKTLAKIIGAGPVFLLSKTVFPDRKKVEEAAFTADFTYKTYIDPSLWSNITDRRSDTKWQILWSAEPADNLVIVQIDLQETTPVDLIDIVAGFYTTGEAYLRKYSFTNAYSLQYSLNGSDYYYIGKDTSGFDLQAGDTASFDSGALGEGFQARYLRILLDKAEKVNYGAADPKTGKIPDAWMAALTEIRIYKDSILSGECKLTPTESQGQQAGWLYDPDDILTKAGDVVYKVTEVNEYLDTQEKVNDRAKGLLREFYKNHTKAQVDIVYHPSIIVGDTITVVDSLNNINRNYFVEAISSNNGRMSLTLGYYPI